MKTVGLIEARMGSTRLPGKVMREFCGRPMVWHIGDRLRRVDGIDQLVMATTADSRNAPLVAFAEQHGMAVFRAELEDDIAGRLAGAMRLTEADAIMKINGDCPLVDPAVLQILLDRFVEAGDADYASNKVTWSYPLGLSAEVIGRTAVDWCDENLATPQDRELVANWIRDHPDRFKVISVSAPYDVSHLDLTVDTAEDFAEVNRIFEALYREDDCFGLDEILEFLGVDPH